MDGKVSVPSWIKLLESPSFRNQLWNSSGLLVQSRDDDNKEDEKEGDEDGRCCVDATESSEDDSWDDSHPGSNHSLSDCTLPVADYNTPPVVEYNTAPVADYNAMPVADYNTPVTRPTPTYLCLSHLSMYALQGPQSQAGGPCEALGVRCAHNHGDGVRASAIGYPLTGGDAMFSPIQTHAPRMEQDAQYDYFRLDNVLCPVKATPGRWLHPSHCRQQSSPSPSGSGSNSLRHVTQPGLRQPEPLGPATCCSALQEVQAGRSSCDHRTLVVTSVIVVMGLVIVGLAAALTVSVMTGQDGGNADKAYPVVTAIVSLKILNKNFTAGMAQLRSDEFYRISRPYSVELDQLFLTSPLADIYRGNKILSLSKGSIKADAQLVFLDTGLIRDTRNVENVISSADRAIDWRESDAREMGDFVVCGDCVKVELNFTKVDKLPNKPVLTSEVSSLVSSTGLPGKPEPSTGPTEKQSFSTSTEDSVTNTSSDNKTRGSPNIFVSSSQPFLQDGHFIVACKVTQLPTWTSVIIEFSPEERPSSEKGGRVVLASFSSKFPQNLNISETYRSRLVASHAVSLNRFSVVMNITRATCRDRGLYICRLVTDDGKEYEGLGFIEIQELPTVPVIDETKDSTLWDATPGYSCSAKLGYPPGTLSLRPARSQGPTFDPVISNVTRTGKPCDAEAVVSVSVFHPALRQASRIVCQVSSVHLSSLDSTQYSAFHTISVTRKLEIQTKSTSINDGLAAIRCRLVNFTSWQKLTLYKLTSSEEPSEVISVTPAKTVSWSDFYLSHRSLTVVDVSASLADLDVFIHSLKCVDEGMYACAVQAPEVNVTWPMAFLTVTAKPGPSDLEIPADAVQNEIITSPIVCQARVGRPAGSIVLKVKNPGEENFQYLSFNEQTTTPISCTTEMRGLFYPNTDRVSNSSIFSCEVIPHETLAADVTDRLEASSIFYVIPDDYCKGRGDGNVSHPTDCRHYVTCKSDVIAKVSKCREGRCFDPGAGNCSAEVPRDNSYDPQKDVCYPDKDYITYPHVDGCHIYIQCDLGREIIQHCPRDAIFASGMECTVNVRESQCYKAMDTTRGVVTNSTIVGMR